MIHWQSILSSNIKWWEIFNDPILDTLVITALKQNKNVNVAIARIEEVRANLGFTEADIYPRFDIEKQNEVIMQVAEFN